MGEALVVGGCRLSYAPVGHGTRQVHVCRGGRDCFGQSDMAEGHRIGPRGGDAACPRVTGAGGCVVSVPHGDKIRSRVISIMEIIRFIESVAPCNEFFVNWLIKISSYVPRIFL
ncbi:hypothetical protein PIB30_071334 [Stylosanthes scabra]|uniref:Uncharacterized protein n=1 Tax=Stylosanthes scabra TaxID=79078 RepID=A0ABU6SPB6_9FABA|nr:hypothetical protein [Stylosanthes scabra]